VHLLSETVVFFGGLLYMAVYFLDLFTTEESK